MDDYECVTPKFEHFGITEHTMCMNEDYTISLIHKTQTMNKLVKRNDNGGNVPDMTPKRIVVTSVPKSNVRTKNAADWMASPMGFMFCTPNKKVSSQKNSKEQVKLGGETELVTKNGAKAKKYKESSIPFAVSPDEDPKHLGDPSPPTIEHCDQLLNTPPPPPEITRIPGDVLQILSKYNHKVDFSKEMETKAGNATRYESDSTDCCNKENRRIIALK
ncbi:spindle and kinetochore-associated protein 3 [Willisornis vidua]|uniref:Spindle and kinetochore-associated protein 3 n=1 Tax=Willisornis vidua TaxID=1566151 RepID=A0ABQ9D342_9PASS|nr:spindle and kinetochore-associated protein 3 [Willisornis vidua]